MKGTSEKSEQPFKEASSQLIKRMFPGLKKVSLGQRFTKQKEREGKGRKKGKKGKERNTFNQRIS